MVANFNALMKSMLDIVATGLENWSSQSWKLFFFQVERVEGEADLYMLPFLDHQVLAVNCLQALGDWTAVERGGLKAQPLDDKRDMIEIGGLFLELV